MAALIFSLCAAFSDFYDFSQAFRRTGFDFAKSLRYLQAKKRLILFNKYCRELWLKQLELEERSEKNNESDIDLDSISLSIQNCSDNLLLSSCGGGDKEDSVDYYYSNIKMKSARNRGGAFIDFAAEEATADSIDRYNAAEFSRNTQMRTPLAAGAYHQQSTDNFDDIEVLSGLEIDTSYHDYIEAEPLYREENLTDLKEGLSFTIKGFILVNCERFSINFIVENTSRDIALHINPRLPQNYIVRNTRVNQVWGQEEVSSPLAFSLQRGKKFSIQVLITEEAFMISVNGIHFAKYDHRLPYRNIKTIEVKGDIEHVEVDKGMATEYPERLSSVTADTIKFGLLSPFFQRATQPEEVTVPTIYDVLNKDVEIPQTWRFIKFHGSPDSVQQMDTAKGLTMPYFGTLPEKALIPGRAIKIEGRIKLLPHSFYINLQKGRQVWPHPVIAFHFNPRFSKTSGATVGKAIVCRNAWYNGTWGKEERSELDTNLRPGRTFCLMIYCHEDEFEVYVDSKLITSFKYHFQPDVVDTLYIQGDIKLWNVMLEGNVEPNGEARIYQNPGYNGDEVDK